MARKSLKGTVSVVAQDKMLRLRWRVDGKRYVLSLGLADNPLHRRIAQGKASEIQADIAFDRFDRTLKKYRGEVESPPSTAMLWRRFTTDRIAQGTSKATAQKYSALAANLDRFGQIASSLDAEKFIAMLRSRQKPLTANQNLSLLKGFGAWACDRGDWPTNYFVGIKAAKGSRPARAGEPFSKAEIRTLLETMQGDRYYAHYHDVSLFLFSTGCRPNEAFRLTWRQVDLDKGIITIVATKTDHEHRLKIQPQLLKMLHHRHRTKPFGSHLVFPAPKGGPINHHSFSQRCWRSICRTAGIPYRVPNFTRHTLASHLIDEGASYPQVAYVLGHKSTRMVAQTYGRMVDPPKLPEFQAGHELGTN